METIQGPNYLILKGVLLKEIPLSSISTSKLYFSHQLKAVRGTYLQISAEKKAKIGQCATEHGLLATVQYYVIRSFPSIPLTNNGFGILSSTHLHNYFNKILKTNYPQNFRFAKYKYYTVFFLLKITFCHNLKKYQNTTTTLFVTTP